MIAKDHQISAVIQGAIVMEIHFPKTEFNAYLINFLNTKSADQLPEKLFFGMLNGVQFKSVEHTFIGNKIHLQSSVEIDVVGKRLYKFLAHNISFNINVTVELLPENLSVGLLRVLVNQLKVTQCLNERNKREDSWLVKLINAGKTPIRLFLTKEINKRISKDLQKAQWLDDYQKVLDQLSKFLHDNAIDLYSEIRDVSMSSFKSHSQETILTGKIQLIENDSKLVSLGSIAKLPFPKWVDVWDQNQVSSFVISIETNDNSIKYFLSQNLLEKEFTKDNKILILKEIVEIELLEIFRIVLDVTGTFEGRLTLTGRINFSEVKQKFSVEDFDFDMDSQSLLAKAGLLFIKPGIKRKINEALDFYLVDQHQSIETAIQNAIDSALEKYPLKTYIDIRKFHLRNWIMKNSELKFDIETYCRLYSNFYTR